MPSALLDATVASTTALTPRVQQLLLRVEDHTFEHTPGQHVSVRRDTDDGPAFRPYSPVSLPGTDTIALAVKRYEGGVCSPWLHERQVGDPVPITPPSGNLHLHDPDRDALFLATGTGLTPMLAMLTQYVREGGGQAALVFGERTQEDLMYRALLDRLAASHDNITVQYVLSHEDWSGATGFVQDHLGPLLEALDAPHAYVCGVPAMVVETKAELQAAGVPADRVFSEGWEEGAVDE
ncbi:MAG: ferredoxin--NADP reductase [Salinivenus sp.]